MYECILEAFLKHFGNFLCNALLSFLECTANGQNCVFPFKYQGKEYNSCTKAESDNGKAAGIEAPSLVWDIKILQEQSICSLRDSDGKSRQGGEEKSVEGKSNWNYSQKEQITVSIL